MSLPVRALIVDDEAPGRTNLALALAPFAGWQVVAQCEGASDARAAVARTPVDVAFIDVQMPVESGLELARSLCALPAPPLLVFVTAYSRYAIEAFEVHALDYLLKPLDDDRLGQALARAEDLLRLKQQAGHARAVRDCVEDTTRREAGAALAYLRRVNVRSVGRVEAVDLADVAWIGSAGNYVELHLGRRSVLHRIPLSRLEPRLDPADFVRAHRTAILRRDQLRELSVVSDGSYLARLQCGASVPVSGRHIAALRAVLAGEDAGPGALREPSACPAVSG
jgi:two-component system LytT family response regulator